jgi:hypothetical protein
MLVYVGAWSSFVMPWLQYLLVDLVNPTNLIITWLFGAVVQVVYYRSWRTFGRTLGLTVALLIVATIFLWPLRSHYAREKADWDEHAADYELHCRQQGTLPKSIRFRGYCHKSQVVLYQTPFELALQYAWNDAKETIYSFFSLQNILVVLSLVVLTGIVRPMIKRRLYRSQVRRVNLKGQERQDTNHQIKELLARQLFNRDDRDEDEEDEEDDHDPQHND